ncbi:MAG: CheR family methyltransferase [Burkholderiaceae bacterium]
MNLRRLLPARESDGVARALAASAAECRRLRGAVGKALGLQLDSLGERHVARVLARCASDAGATVAAYLDELEARPTAAGLAALAQELTVGETYFFRHAEQFDALRGWAARRARDGRPIRVLSAGCASGEEPYSIAMVLRDAMPAGAWTIRAVDVNPAAIAKARRARYTRWALRATPPALLQRWMRADGAGIVLDEAIRRDVAFEQRNLCADDPALWAPDAYDVVFCRNVLIHLARPAAEALATRLVGSVAPGGALFLGHAESLRGLVDGPVPREAHGAFWYERAPHDLVHASTPDAWAGGPIRAAGDPLATALGRAPMDAPAALTRLPVDARAALAPPPDEPPPSDVLARAFELLRQERFGDALAAVLALPAAAAGEPRALLLRGMLLAHGGDYAQAARLGTRLLARDESDADAYHLLALCREGQGDPCGALDCGRRAVALDPDFALARMHLGLLARRARHLDEARRQFGRAVALLAREPDDRLALFGGGFGRDALLAMCRAEVQACGEPA